ncbi:TLC domain-containing protein 3A-like isoform X2 [Tigriopus californicus]|uniref:TLC domain-containing protein 3A-like isoform X2 n=1 Tax=Tigriopus californicus TaxID=6832 RepID=UPI0027DA8461|nr:TLC domain-containing protein 3A-like isoform X2 [Tigriopus californicus]
MCFPMYPWGLMLTCSSATVYYLLGWKVEHAYASKILSRYSSLSYQTRQHADTPGALSGIPLGRTQDPMNVRILEFSNWITTLIHALLAALGGGVLMWNTHHDIIYGRNCVLADTLAYHSLGYFIFDSYSLIRLFHSKIKTTRLSTLIWYRPDLSFHHFGVIFIFTPIVLYFRRGLGDFFVGMAFLMELSTPFLALKGLLQILDLRSAFSRGFLLNSMVLTLTFLMARLFPLPYAYWLYAKQSHQSLWEACCGLAWHCNLGTVALFAFQGYWFISMVRSTTRLFYEEVVRASHVPPSNATTTTTSNPLSEPREKRE